MDNLVTVVRLGRHDPHRCPPEKAVKLLASGRWELPEGTPKSIATPLLERADALRAQEDEKARKAEEQRRLSVSGASSAPASAPQPTPPASPSSSSASPKKKPE